MNILLKANEIIFERSEEKERSYGPIDEGMHHASLIASAILKKDINTVDMYVCMIALKLSRESYKHKEDNLLDSVAYIAALNSYKEKIKC